MKKFKNLVFLALFFAATTWAVSCGNSKSDHGGHDHDTTLNESGHGEGKEYTSAYICPMHCKDSGSETEGKCPVCGMDYVAKNDHDARKHKH